MSEQDLHEPFMPADDEAVDEQPATADKHEHESAEHVDIELVDLPPPIPRPRQGLAATDKHEHESAEHVNLQLVNERPHIPPRHHGLRAALRGVGLEPPVELEAASDEEAQHRQSETADRNERLADTDRERRDEVQRRRSETAEREKRRAATDRERRDELISTLSQLYRR